MVIDVEENRVDTVGASGVLSARIALLYNTIRLFPLLISSVPKMGWYSRWWVVWYHVLVMNNAVLVYKLSV